MDTSNKYPSWNLLPSLPNTPLIDAQIVVDDSRELLFTVYAGNKMWVSDPSSVFTDGWDQDLGLVPFSNTLKAFVLDDALGRSTNKSTWGYLVASTTGLKSCTGGAFSSRQIPIIVRISITLSTDRQFNIPFDRLRSIPGRIHLFVRHQYQEQTPVFL